MDFHSIVGKLRAIETLGMHNRSIEEDASCTMTAEGEACPVHGLEECPGYMSAPLEEGPDRDGEYFSNADVMADTTSQSTAAIPDPIATPPGVEEDSKPKLSSEFLSKLSGDLSELAKMIEAAQADADDRESMEEEAPLGPMPFAPLGATNDGPDQQGFVVTGGTNVNYFESEQAQLMEGLTINTTRDVRDGKVTKSINISATDEDAEQLASLLRHAGLGMEVHGMPHAAAEPAPRMVVSQTMENADHDVGHDLKSEVGEPLDVQEYIWDGPHINQRFGKIGDNTLESQRKETIFKALTEEYDTFLSEAELPPASVGSQSPLTATTRDTFDKDPFVSEPAVDDGSHSPLSTVKRQDVMN